MKKLIKACYKNNLYFEVASHQDGFSVSIYKHSEFREIFSYDSWSYSDCIDKALKFIKKLRKKS